MSQCAYFVRWSLLAGACAALVNCTDGPQTPPVAQALSNAVSNRPSPGEIEARKARIRAYFAAKASEVPKVATTVTRKGQTLDWILPESQLPAGTKLAAPPGLPPAVALPPNTALGQSELESDPGVRGPAGTVPIVRYDVEGYLKSIDIPPATPEEVIPNKSGPPAPTAQGYYYTKWARNGTWYGAFGTFNHWDPTDLTTTDHSLVQIAVAYLSGTIGQTVEMGTTKDRGLNGGTSSPAVFTYFTTSNYMTTGNWVGGYNKSVLGFIQYDTTWAPGMLISGSSVYNGAQVEMSYWAQLDAAGGNWWLSVNGHWIGYYPGCKAQNCSMGSLFANPGLKNSGNLYVFQGEVDDVSGAPGSTFTDMGSGIDSSQGYQKAAYVRQMGRFTNYGTYEIMTSDGGLNATDANCYSGNGAYFFGGSGVWDNYFYYGGPGRNNAACR
jgi:hypothetical protein